MMLSVHTKLLTPAPTSEIQRDTTQERYVDKKDGGCVDGYFNDGVDHSTQEDMDKAW